MALARASSGLFSKSFFRLPCRAILSGIILATGRVVGETAALIYTAGTVAHMLRGPWTPDVPLAVHMYVLSTEGLHMEKAFATAVILLVMVLLINAVSGYFAKKLTKGQ